MHLDCARKVERRRRFRPGSAKEQGMDLKAGVITWPRIFTDETRIETFDGVIGAFFDLATFPCVQTAIVVSGREQKGTAASSKGDRRGVVWNRPLVEGLRRPERSEGRRKPSTKGRQLV